MMFDKYVHGAGLYVHIDSARDGLIPVRASDEATGYDLRSDEFVILGPGDYKAVSTGIRLDFTMAPEDLDVQIRPRSGLAAKNGVTVLNSPGTIDRDYQGLVKVVLINHGKHQFIIRPGDRIAQMVLGSLVNTPLLRIAEYTPLPTVRMGNGFGSTGYQAIEEKDMIDKLVP